MPSRIFQAPCLVFGLLGALSVACADEPSQVTSSTERSARPLRPPVREARVVLQGGDLTLEGGAVGTLDPVLASGSKLTVLLNHFMNEAEDGTLTLESEFPAQCRGTTADGRVDFAVTAYARVNGLTTTQTLLDPEYLGTRFESAAPFTVEVPRPTDHLGLELWFTGGPAAGPVEPSCTTTIHRLPIVDVSLIPVIHFLGDGRTLVTEVGGKGLVAGTFALLRYDRERLEMLSPRCDGITGYAGGAAWDVRAYLRIDGRDLESPLVSFPESWSTRGLHDLLIKLPEDSHELTVWFVVSGWDYYHGGPELSSVPLDNGLIPISVPIV